jgi:nicotinamidase-related amidase
MIFLIIDMQVGLFGSDTPRFDADGVVSRINELAKIIRNKDGSVIFIQHDGPKDDSLEPGTNGWEILPELERHQTDIVVRKRACDSFYETNLLNEISRIESNLIIISGCATDFCVDTTIRSAASKDFEVIVAADCHTTGDRPHLGAEKIIQHHNWVWENLILPRNKIGVVTSDELKTQV